MASWKSINFEELHNGGQYPAPQAPAVLVKTHYPGGNRNAAQYLGNGPRSMTVDALCTLAEYNTLSAQRGQLGTLITGYGTIPNMILETVGGYEREDYDSGTSYWFAQLAFTEVTD